MTGDQQSQSHHRKSIRLPEYDYTHPGAYFVTIVADRRRKLFGQVRGGVMRLSAFGQVVEDCWREIPAHFPGVGNAIFMVMPNHFHGIVEMNEIGGAAGARHASPVCSNPLGVIVGSFKSAVSRKIHRLPGGEGIKVWQRNYFEHIIRDEGEYERIAGYIRANPENWKADWENWG